MNTVKFLLSITFLLVSKVTSATRRTSGWRYVKMVNPFLDGIVKVKDLIQELEESFRESSIVGNNLILRCVLLRAENQNLAHKMDLKKKNLSTSYYNKQWLFSVLSQDKSIMFDKDLSGVEMAHPSQSKTSFHLPVACSEGDEIDILHKTIKDLHKKLRERDKKIELLCQKYIYLKTNKKKMENDLKSKILSLEKQLDFTYDTLNKFQNEVEDEAEKNMSATEDTFEALFLQEKLRCSKLMYEKVRLQHEIRRLEDSIRRQNQIAEENEGLIKSSLDKCLSEPLMKHF